MCSITAPTSTAEGYTPSYSINLGDQTFDITADGTMSAADLHSYVASQFGRRPVVRDVNATVSMWLGNGTTTVKTGITAK